MKTMFKVNNVDFLDNTNIDFAGEAGEFDKEEFDSDENGWFYRLKIKGALIWFKVEACQFVLPKKLSEMDEQEKRETLAIWRLHTSKIAPEVAIKRILKGLGQAIFE